MHQLAAPWPDYQALLAVDRTQVFNLGRRLRLALALCRTRGLRESVDRAVIRCPWLRAVMDRHPILFRPLLTQFLDGRSDRRTAFTNFAHDLEFVSTRIHAACPWFFPSALNLTLWTGGEQRYTAAISLNLAHPQEGLWQLALYSPAGVRLFSICFSVLPGPLLFVGAVQGGRSQGGVRFSELIRLATRQLEGLRPHFLLFEVLRALSGAWGIERCVGVATRHQLKSRSRRAMMSFSYDDYFRELGAIARADGNWEVPVRVAERHASAVPSRKRAMYRRRAVLLTQMRAAVHGELAAPPVRWPG